MVDKNELLIRQLAYQNGLLIGLNVALLAVVKYPLDEDYCEELYDLVKKKLDEDLPLYLIEEALPITDDPQNGV